MDYLHALLPDARTDVVFTGYQASGTLGRSLQKKASHVLIEHSKVAVRASVYSMSGYSAHADQTDLTNYIVGCKSQLKQLHLIHGDSKAKQALAECVAPHLAPGTCIVE
ncbi:metallo-beta-lactamase family protein RNA-specific [Vibrio maritimus]|uniref:Metallo-beta-lactamase family protein RNA-specific n=1 Tax=Vibrio maritimus TaxID=990268 RepID=A0A090TCC9_9VIBR|nr:metallo-beta-lactamase family protein RNA-specific [Vibrio maritimus]